MRKKEEEIKPIQERSFRHIIFGTIFFGILFSLLGIFIWETKLRNIKPSTKTLGVSTENKIVLPDKKDAENILKNVQKEINAITPENITSSDSAILRIIEDLERLRSGDANALETVCSRVCGRLYEEIKKNTTENWSWFYNGCS